MAAFPLAAAPIRRAEISDRVPDVRIVFSFLAVSFLPPMLLSHRRPFIQ